MPTHDAIYLQRGKIGGPVPITYRDKDVLKLIKLKAKLRRNVLKSNSGD